MTARRFRRAAASVAAIAVLASAAWLAVSTSGRPTGPAQAASAGARGPGGSGEDETGETIERLSALLDAEIDGTLGRIEPIERDPAPGWAGARIVHPSHDDWEPAVAADPNDPWVYVAVTRYGAPLCADCPDATIMFERSKDGGKTWSKARPVCRCEGTAWQADPILEVARDTGSVYAIWMNGWDVHFSRSDDHGRTWTEPVSTKGKAAWNDKPAMTVSDDGQDVFVSWNGPSGGDAFVARSNDGGATWRRRKVVDSDRYYFAYDGTITPSGSVVLAESSLDYSGPDGAPVGTVKHHALISDDGGDTWRNVVVGSGRIGPPCVAVACPNDYYLGHSSVASDADGNLVFVFDALESPWRPPAHLGDHVERRRHHLDDARRRLDSARAVRVPDGRRHRLRRHAHVVHGDRRGQPQRLERLVPGVDRRAAPCWSPAGEAVRRHGGLGVPLEARVPRAVRGLR